MVYGVWVVLTCSWFFMRYIQIMLKFTGGPCVCFETITMVENILINQTMEGHLYSYIKGHTTYIHIRKYHLYTYVQGNIIYIFIEELIPCTYLLANNVHKHMDK